MSRVSLRLKQTLQLIAQLSAPAPSQPQETNERPAISANRSWVRLSCTRVPPLPFF